MPSFKQRPSFTGLPGSGTLLFGLCLNYLVIQKDFSNKYKSQMFVKQMISVLGLPGGRVLKSSCYVSTDSKLPKLLLLLKSKRPPEIGCLLIFHTRDLWSFYFPSKSQLYRAQIREQPAHPGLCWRVESTLQKKVFSPPSLVLPFPAAHKVPFWVGPTALVLL